MFQTFDQQGFAEAKAHKKPGKIYYFSTFQGHRDSIIKRLVCKSGKVQDNDNDNGVTMTPKRREVINLSWFFKGMFIYFNKIDHFRVALNLIMKARLSAKFLL